MTFPELIESTLDELLPPPPGFPPLRYLEDRHIVRAYLISGSMQKAEPLLKIAYRTLRFRMAKIFTRAQILALPGNRGRTDIGFLIEYLAQRTPPGIELPSSLTDSPVWRDAKVRAPSNLHSMDQEPTPAPAAEEDDGLTYPCHRDFAFFDWYYNQDCIKQPKPHDRGGRHVG